MDKGIVSKNNKELKWTLLHEQTTNNFDKLYELYSIDKDRARIYYFLHKTNYSFTRNRTILFEYENGDFRFVKLVKKIGISSTGNIYTTEKTIEAISYNKRNGFYHFDNLSGRGGFIKQLSYINLITFSTHLTPMSFSEELNNVKKPNMVIDYMIERFGWIRYVRETKFTDVPFNVIKRKKLFNLKAMYRHVYGCPYPQAKIVHERANSNTNGPKYLKVWNEQKKYLINIESLNKEFFNNPLFIDSCRMAQMVGKKVNCSWSEKRLKSEHDNWAKAITQVLLETEELRELKIAPIFKEFAEHSGFEMLLTNHALLEEGIRMNHCVGSYSSSVDSGQCAIYRIFDCTLELRISSFTNKETNISTTNLVIGQYMDFGNTRAPQDSWNYVNEMLGRFKPSSNAKIFGDILVPVDDLPF